MVLITGFDIWFRLFTAPIGFVVLGLPLVYVGRWLVSACLLWVGCLGLWFRVCLFGYGIVWLGAAVSGVCVFISLGCSGLFIAAGLVH